MIGYYAPRRAALATSDGRLTGTAYGPRLFGPGPDGRSQFDRAMDLLRTEQDSKRATGDFASLRLTRRLRCQSLR
jgi:thymidylate synthase